MSRRLLSTADAARRLGVSRVRVGALIRDGILKADRLGRVWVVDEESLEVLASRGAEARVKALEANDAWAAAMLLDGDDAVWVTPQRRASLERRLRRVSPNETGQWSWLMSRRAVRSLAVWVHPDLLPALAREVGLRLPETGLLPSGTRVEGGRILAWVSFDRLISVIQRPEVVASSRPNLVIRAWPLSVNPVRQVPTLVAAADLLDEPDSRCRSAGAWLLRHSVAGTERQGEQGSGAAVRSLNPTHARGGGSGPEARPATASAPEDRPRPPKKDATAKRNEKPYDEQTPEEQERTRQLWEEDIRRTREGLNYAERFAAEGRRFTEAKPDGSIVQHIPDNERAHERPTDEGELRNRYDDHQRGADFKKSHKPNS